MSRALLLKLRSEFRRVADPTKAPGMQRYMKSSMPYYGVAAPALKQVCRDSFSSLQFDDAVSWRNAVLHIFRNARCREEWYAAVELCRWKKAAPFQTLEMLPVYEELIVGAAWWDVVDTLASHGVGGLLRAYPKPIAREMRAWSRSDNLWKRRTSILCQLSFKERTDLKLLYSCIEPLLHSKEFFLRKAIGWALRQYAWTDPAEVRRYIRSKGSRLSPLSKREALKNIR
jgi:3-methyladenine DNA glycosylase AlkD